MNYWLELTSQKRNNLGLFNPFQKLAFPFNYISHRNLYLLGLSIVLAGLAWSNFLMSLGQIVLFCNWILELDFKSKWLKLKSKPIILVLISIFFIHLIGLLWTSDFKYGSHDLNIKLPLLILPLVIGTSPALKPKEWKALLWIYLSSCFIISLASLYKLLGFSQEAIYDKRELSILISHIRYGLNLCLASILAIHLYWKSKLPLKAISIFLTIWFAGCLFWFELSTGLVCLFISGIFSLIYFTFSEQVKVELKMAFLMGILGILFFGTSEILSIRQDYYHTVKLNYDQDEHILNSANGEPYYFNYESELKENGVYLWRFVAIEELKRSWNRKSKIHSDSLDHKGQSVFNTLVRFLSAKGLKKDSVGLSHLNSEEIQAIENGIPNPYYLNHNPIQNRIYQTFYEFDSYRSHDQIDGFSLAMRLEYWKNSWRIIKKNIWFGVGTGDVKQSIARQYEMDDSPLGEDFRKRTHNQYLSIWLSLGIVGLLIFLFSILYPILQINKERRYLFLIFSLIVALSYLSEDTLETQAGVSFVALFTSLLLLARPSDSQ